MSNSKLTPGVYALCSALLCFVLPCFVLFCEVGSGCVAQTGLELSSCLSRITGVYHHTQLVVMPLSRGFNCFVTITSDHKVLGSMTKRKIFNGVLGPLSHIGPASSQTLNSD